MIGHRARLYSVRRGVSVAPVRWTALYTMVFVTVVIAACADDTPTPTATVHDLPVVLAKAPSAPALTWFSPSDAQAAGHALVPDGPPAYQSAPASVSGSYTRYRHAECGVNATIQGSGDATVQTNNPNFRDRRCEAYPRKMTIRYFADDAMTQLEATETIEFFINVSQLHTVAGVDERRSMGINPTQTTRCDALRFTSERAGELIAGDSVLVTRVSPRLWRVRSQDRVLDGQGNVVYRDRAFCTTLGRSYRMPFAFYIESDADIPLP